MSTDFSISDTKLFGAKLITPFYTEDERGYFLKGFEKDVFKRFGLEIDIYEDFESYSKQSVIRGLHFQTKNPQIKLIRVIIGSITDVIVDLRQDSISFGQWETFELSSENRKQLWVPRGFAHGFCVKSTYAVVSYKCIGKYDKEFDTGIVWNDPELSIPWGLSNPIVSVRDTNLMTLDEYKRSLS